MPTYRMNFVLVSSAFALDFNSVCLGHNYQIIINVIHLDLAV